MPLAQIIDNQPVEVTGTSVVHNNTQSSVETIMAWSPQERAASGFFEIADEAIAPGMVMTGSSLEYANGQVTRKFTTTARVFEKGEVDDERDRRLSKFTFAGTVFDFGGTATVDIAGAGTLALAAIINGAQPGNLRWANPASDFAWIAANNTSVPMDAQTCFAFAQAAAQWRSAHIFAARTIKDTNPIPADYTANARWPS